MNEFDQQSPNSMLRPLEPRPKTKLLKQPTPNLTLPIIDYADKYRRKHQLRAAEANELIVVGRLCLAGIQGNHRLSSYSSISSVFPNDRALRPVDETKAVKPLDRTTEQSSRPESHVFRQRVAGQKVYHYNRSGRPNDQRLNRIDSNENAFNSKNEPSSSSAVESRSASSLQQISLTCYVCGQSLPIDQLVAHEQQCKLDVSLS